MNRVVRLVRVSIFLSAIAGIGCSEDTESVGATPARGLLITTSDFVTSSLAFLNLETRQFSLASENLSDQDTAPELVGERTVLLERGAGRVRFQSEEDLRVTDFVVDLNQAATSFPYSVNPQMIVPISNEKAYVVALALNSLIVLNPTQTGEEAKTGSIDLSPLISSSDMDGNVDASQAILVGSQAFVALGRYYFDSMFTIHFDAGSVLAVVDTASNALVDMNATDQGVQGIELEGNNPWRDLWHNASKQELWVGSAGSSFAEDGGIEAVDLKTRTSKGYVLTEEQLDGELEGFAAVSANRVWVLSKGRIVMWNPETNTIDPTPIATNVSGMLVQDSDLFAWSRDGETPGLRVFSATTGQETTPNGQPYTFGSLPIYGVAPVL